MPPPIHLPMKNCPFCAEEIQEAAIKCKHCGEILDDTKHAELTQGRESRQPQTTDEPQVKVPWYAKPSTLVLIVACAGPLAPLAIPLVFLNPKWSKPTKIVISVVIVVVSALLTWATWKSVQNLMEVYNEMMKMMG